MSTVFRDLQAAVAALLLGAPALAGGRVFQQRRQPVVREHSSAINVRLVRASATRASVASGPTDWTTTLGIECYYRAASAAENPIDGLDPILQAAYARLAGQGAALAIGVEDVLPDPDIEWEEEEGETPLAYATFVVQIVHRTQATQLVPWN